ncbi:MAG: hypothetical protein Q9160_001266 [Pyrenula sp. 1 TL-2023]
MSEKKRKNREGHDERPRKKTTLDKPSGVLKVNYLSGSKESTPAIVSSPGLSLPSHLQFEPYVNRNSRNPELLLHSSTHPSIDFTAQEEDDEEDTKHYIAVYDPKTKSLQLTEAKHLTARATVRHLQPEAESDSDSSAADTAKTPQRAREARAALTDAFGTKKSKKIFAALNDNALSSRADDRHTNDNPLSSALLSSQPLSALLSEPTDQLIQENKPIPQPDLSANIPSEVYPLSALVHPAPGLTTLFSLPVSAWINAAKVRQPISAPSKFIANRITPIAVAAAKSSSMKDPLPLQHLSTLRYILLLLNIFRLATSRSARYPKLPLDTKKWPDALSEPGPINRETLEGLRRKYAPDGGVMTNFDVTLLKTTICALTLHIPPPSGIAASTSIANPETSDGNDDDDDDNEKDSDSDSDSAPTPSTKPTTNKKTKPKPTPLTSPLMATFPTDIAHDLALDASDIRKLYRELGCRLEKPKTDDEARKWGIRAKSGAKVKDEDKGEEDGGGMMMKKKKGGNNEIAVLRFPLRFPAVGKGRSGR